MFLQQGIILKKIQVTGKKVSCKEIILVSHAALFMQKWPASPFLAIPIKITSTVDYLDFLFKWTIIGGFESQAIYLGCPPEYLGACFSSCKFKNAKDGPLVVSALL